MHVPGLSPIEVASGSPIGPGRRMVPSPAAGTRSPLAALEEAVEPAVRRSPCLVAFSGGRDSSLVLAAAVRAARTGGHPMPMAVTGVLPGLPETDELEWQARVLRHLGVEDWERLEFRAELDFVGEVAAELVSRYGPRHPPNLHAMLPLLRAGRGGALIVGLGGDEVFAGHRWEWLNDALAGRRRLRPGDAGRVAAAALPRGLRGTLVARRKRVERELPWLRPPARRLLARARRGLADSPVRWSRAVWDAASERSLQIALAELRRIGRAEGVELHTPLVDGGFLTALTVAGGTTGWGGRTATMRAVADGVLPDAVLSRRGKATFTRAFFGPATRAFATRWSGGGVDPALVDPEALRKVWLGRSPDYRSALLLQVAWAEEDGLLRNSA